MEVATVQNESRKKAAALIKRSLSQIETAQGHILEARGSISRIAGLAEEYAELGRLYDKIKAGWHRLNMRTACGNFEMDSWWKQDYEASGNLKGGR